MFDTDHENVMCRSRADNAAYIIDQVRLLELNPDPTSRLMRMFQVLRRGDIPFDDPEFPIALEAERDLQQLGFVFDQMHTHHDKPIFRSLVKRLLKDSVQPQNIHENSPGRDTQFELYLAAICQNAGLTPVECEEPDVTCTIKGCKYGIAAKRFKNLSQLEKHVRKAAKQIAGTRLPGVIALELSLARNQLNLPIISRIQSQLYVPITQLADKQFFDEHRENIYRWVADKGVLGIIVFDFKIRLRPDNNWGLDGMTTWLSTSHDDKQANHYYRAFQDGFLSGVPNLTKLGFKQ